jgi:hypothetical protein
MNYDRIAHISVGKTNKDPCALMDLVRRQLDYLGPRGIKMKAGQTDDLFRQNGFLKFTFPDAAMRRKFIDRVEANCASEIQIKLLKKRREK